MELYSDIYPTQLYFDNYEKVLNKIIIGKKCIIVTTKNSSYKLGIIETITKYLKENNIEYFIYDKITANPLYTSIQECIELTKDFNSDFIIGIGGGSAIDAAKSVSLMKNGVDIINDAGKGIPITGILTLSGSGTEVTPYSILTFPNNVKRSIKSQMFLSHCIIDKSLQDNLSIDYKACLIIDIFSHLIESYLSIKANEKSMNASIEGIKLVYRKDIENINLNEIDQIHSSIIGGAVITITGTAIPHGLGYYMTTHYNISHGFACGIFSNAYLKLAQTQPICKERLNRLNKELNINEGDLGIYVHSLVKKYMKPLEKKIELEEIEIMTKEFFDTGKNKQHPDDLTIDNVKQLIIDSLSN